MGFSVCKILKREQICLSDKLNNKLFKLNSGASQFQKQLSLGGIRERERSLIVSLFGKKSVILATTSDATKIVVTEHLSLG